MPFVRSASCGRRSPFFLLRSVASSWLLLVRVPAAAASSDSPASSAAGASAREDLASPAAAGHSRVTAHAISPDGEALLQHADLAASEAVVGGGARVRRQTLEPAAEEGLAGRRTTMRRAPPRVSSAEAAALTQEERQLPTSGRSQVAQLPAEESVSTTTTQAPAETGAQPGKCKVPLHADRVIGHAFGARESMCFNGATELEEGSACETACPVFYKTPTPAKLWCSCDSKAQACTLLPAADGADEIPVVLVASVSCSFSPLVGGFALFVFFACTSALVLLLAKLGSGSAAKSAAPEMPALGRGEAASPAAEPAAAAAPTGGEGEGAAAETAPAPS
eukprot:TRINITY_DN65545_c0_g1_i1.p1 TRINITY_DN65545_c0_g1~~TRINITY_DN65545_c0_g1_i1.p1  ORF type:complete len:336 (+),score=93.09 TRINITY_DN65545_c0_g1_i1:101-1108(+)